MRATLTVFCLLVTTAGLAGRAAARPPARAANLIASPAVHHQIRIAFLSGKRLNPAKVRGPIPGTLYYARYRGTYWAIAAFSVPFFRLQGQPTVFRRAAGRQWRSTTDTGGSICPPMVPLPVVKVWFLPYEGSGCYSAPVP